MKKPIIIAAIIISFSNIAKADNLIGGHYSATTDMIFQALTPPEFPGGEEAFHDYLNRNIKWPEYNDRDTLKTMLLSFFIEKDGTLSGLKVEKSWSPGFDAQVMRLVANSPRWIPAMRNSRPIISKYKLPISFRSLHQKNRDN